MLGDHGAVLLIAVVPAVIQLVADQRTQTQTIPIGAVELALCAAEGEGEETFLSTSVSIAEKNLLSKQTNLFGFKAFYCF